jgi:glycine cleavage system H protein
MSTHPQDRRYSTTHQWARTAGPDLVEIGITAHAQDALGDIVFVDLPRAGAVVTAGESFMVIESVKTASDVHAPVSGTVSEVNELLRDQPDALNSDPYGHWLVRVTVGAGGAAAAQSDLLDAAAYATIVGAT